jgi:hypothetical protein
VVPGAVLGTAVSFIGVNMAVNAISPAEGILAGELVDTAWACVLLSNGAEDTATLVAWAGAIADGAMNPGADAITWTVVTVTSVAPRNCFLGASAVP